MGRTKVFKWVSKLKTGVTSVKGAKCLGHPSRNKTYENAVRVKEHVLEQRNCYPQGY